MTEQSITQIIVALIAAGTIPAVLGIFRRKKKTPVTVAEADAAHAHESQQMVLASLNALTGSLRGTQKTLAATQEALAREQERTNALADIVDQLRHARDQDASLIRRLTEWMRDVHARWAVLRLSETPPPLPDTTIQAPPSAGPSS